MSDGIKRGYQKKARTRNGSHQGTMDEEGSKELKINCLGYKTPSLD